VRKPRASLVVRGGQGVADRHPPRPVGQAALFETSLVVDECQNCLNLPRSFDEMLAEARGYRLSMVLAHQHLGQLPRELREAVSANARTWCGSP